jgi:hypothetical protein
MIQQPLRFQGIYRSQKPRNPLDQSFELLNVKDFEAAKIVKNRGLGITLLAVALVMRELDVGGFRAVLIFT